MLKRIVISAFFTLFLLTFSSSAFAQSNMAHGDSVTLAQNKVINSDYFASGNNIKISGTVNGDVYAAGGNITIDGKVNGDVLVAGGDVIVQGTVAHDIRAAGGDITIDAKVAGNVTTVGGDIRLEKDASISGSLTAAGGDIVIASPIKKNIVLASGKTTISNNVGGNISGYIGSLTINPQTKIGGDLTYWSENEAAIDHSASISGKTTHHTPPQHQAQTAREAFSAVATVLRLMGFVSLLILGFLMLAFMPVFSQKTAQDILQHTTRNVFIGFLALIFTPLIILLLFVFILTMPLALVLTAVYFVVIFVGKMFAAYAIGVKMAQTFNWKIRTYWIYSIGLIVLYTVSSIPLVGAFLAFIAMLAGMGAYLNNEKNYYSTLKTKKGI